ncbi:MAG TPA: ornithine cyclodeaminase family protein [Vicinamibacterales bacterium]|nr:ornithine cyclodeaminase family protein [Vicinamibacterales bacterium]
MPLLLRETDVRAVLPMTDLIAEMEVALAQFSAGAVQQPLRTVLEVGSEHAFFGVMPAALRDPDAVGTKLVTVFHSNASRGLPSHLATIVLFDPHTGALVAILDGRYITEARTAAVSAVSTKHLAREGARSLAILGSGVQARSHLEALGCVRTFEEVRVWSPTRAHADAFARDHQAGTPARISVAASPEAAVAGADVVALVTASREPVVRDEWIAPGAHICAVGACRPDQREVDTALAVRARVFVDSRVAALAEAGDLVIPMKEGAIGPSHIVGELGDVVAGRVQGRLGDTDVTMFESLGMAVEDVSAARLAWERALERGLGTKITL